MSETEDLRALVSGEVERVWMAFQRVVNDMAETRAARRTAQRGDESTWAEYCHGCRARIALRAALASDPTTHESEEA